MKLLLIILLTANCISSYVKQNYPTTNYQNTNVPIKLLEIHESENYLKFIWEEMITIKLSKNHRGNEETSEIINFRSTCLDKKSFDNSEIELDISKTCPPEEMFVNIKFNSYIKKEYQIYSNPKARIGVRNRYNGSFK